MELRDILLLVHIAAAGTWLGANIMQAVVPSMAAKQGSQTLAGWYRVAGRLAGPVYIPAGILLLGTGIWMVLVSDAFSFSSVFVTIGFAMIVIGALLGKLVFDSGSERAAAAVESGDQGMAKAAAGRLSAFGALDTLLLLFTIFAMIIRLGA